MTAPTRRFQDDDQRFERRPSLWIEPLGDWGQGSVQLLEIPSDAEINDNILAYWRPKAVMAANSEVALAYRQYWCWQPPDRPPLAIVTATRIGRGSGGRRRRFLVDFTGDISADALADLKPVLTVGPGSDSVSQGLALSGPQDRPRRPSSSTLETKIRARCA